MEAAIADYRSCAQAIASRITDQATWNAYIAPPLNFWRIANAFTTLIDYFAISQQGNLFIGQSTYEAFQKKNSTGWWYDDYGWWIVAFLRASQYSRYVGFDPVTWWQLAQVCWQEMAPSTAVWANADQQYFARAKPRYGGGCWNHNFIRSTDPNPCDPLHATDSWPACGIQNTVTNLQYLVAAARLGQVPDAMREYDFLRNWFFDASVSLDNRLLATYQGIGRLARERVSTFAQAPDGTYPPALNYDKDRFWAGDQGILVGAMLELTLLDPLGQGEYLPIATDALNAVRGMLANNSQILQPWRPPNGFGSAYDTDYATGIGVFMRYLLYVYAANNPVLTPYIGSDAYKLFIQANADAACQSIGNCPPLPDGSSPDQMECLLNQLAVLNAAIVILGP